MGTAAALETIAQPTGRILRLHQEAVMVLRIWLYGKGCMISSLVVPENLWLHVLGELQKRSDGWRESAGVLVGKSFPDGLRKALDVVFHHDIADDRATALSLELPEAAKFKMYEELSKR